MTHGQTAIRQLMDLLVPYIPDANWSRDAAASVVARAIIAAGWASPGEIKLLRRQLNDTEHEAKNHEAAARNWQELHWRTTKASSLRGLSNDEKKLLTVIRDHYDAGHSVLRSDVGYLLDLVDQLTRQETRPTHDEWESAEVEENDPEETP